MTGCDVAGEAGDVAAAPEARDAGGMTVTAAAERLTTAVHTGVPGAPVRELCEITAASDAPTSRADAEMAWAYDVQRAFVASAWPDDAVVGRKIGLTSSAVQAQLGVDQPDFGVLFAAMEVADGASVEADRYIAPRVEGEIAFRLGNDLDGDDVTLDDVRRCVEMAAPAIEICDSRIANWNITILDTVADNASAAGFVLGEWRPLGTVTPRDAAMTMTVSGHEPVEGRGDACLGDPLEAVLWLARTAHRFGQPLRAGHVVLSGALAPMLPFAPGSTVTVTLEGLGSVGVTRGSAA